MVESLISHARIFLANHGFDWYVCGGGAIDVFLGKQTRIHKDLDIAVFWEDRNSIIALMLAAGWRVFEACGGGVIHELFQVQEPFEKRNLFCFTSNENRCKLEPIGDEKYRFGLEKKEQKDFTYIEFLFNQRDDEYFYLPGKANLKRRLNKALLKSNGVPYLAPEVVLFYKSRYLEYSPDTLDHYQDFDLSLSVLDYEQKQWLRESLIKEYANGHEWLKGL
ncbi:hypothetical protein PAESOLCIP111_06675 [Paenibacillus solanacearum]|uniref:Amino acid transporter n=1 Tax=Paenibacillus solanacearum TaxID=2048548 RepID=A0A916NT42_9BACL|nr:hypothetical protein [Paenibacillus solanacearum]CAG7652943.1 hypothetical protein PAESOLCIP111_06675 [Paenibacillus solanacearum]